MDDWTPIGEATQAFGGLLGGGRAALCDRGIDGLVELQVSEMVTYTVPTPSPSTQAAPNENGVYPLGSPTIPEATERRIERDVELPANIAGYVWACLQHAGTFAPAWTGGCLRVPYPPHGLEYAMLYGLRTRAVRNEAPPAAEDRAAIQPTTTRQKGRPAVDDEAAISAAIQIITLESTPGNPVSALAAAKRVASLASGNSTESAITRLRGKIAKRLQQNSTDK